MEWNVIRWIGTNPRLRAATLGLIPLIGFATFLHTDPVLAQTQGDVNNQELTPYQTALLDYKLGKYDDALAAINTADQSNPNTPAIQILKARILTEQGDFAGGEKLLRPLVAPPLASYEARLALGDLLLRKGDGYHAAQFYTQPLEFRPNDPEVNLKLIYALILSNDLINAEKNASQLKPFDPAFDPLDPKHPGNPSYYFAKAAIAHATGKEQEAENDLEPVRTLYGSTITDRYLKTYLEIFAKPVKGPPDTSAPSLSTNSAPVAPAAPTTAKP